MESPRRLACFAIDQEMRGFPTERIQKHRAEKEVCSWEKNHTCNSEVQFKTKS